ncbi:MAG TPA: hypothetical protein VGD35_11365 [Chitinophaga sp.]
MKKMFLMLCVAAALCVNTVWAHSTETEASSKLKAALSQTFAAATHVRWYTEDNKFFTAKFMMGETVVSAYFDADGNLLSTRRYISEEQLPLAVTTKVQKRYPNHKVRSTVEFDASNVTTYYVTLEGDDNWIVLKSDSNGQLSVYQRLKKA